MPQNVNKLKVAVCGFMKRKPEDFVRPAGADTVDLLLQACNNARLYAERMVDFELSTEQAYLNMPDIMEGASLEDCITYDTREEDEEDQVAVRVKKIVTPFVTNNTTDLIPVKLVSKKWWNEKVKRRVQMVNDRTPPLQTDDVLTTSEILLVQQGNTVFLYPASTNTFTNGAAQLALDVIAWLPPYIEGSEEDFLLEFAFDWMMYRAIYELNYFLKEDERVAISDKLMNDSWMALVKWNDELVASTSEDTNMD